MDEASFTELKENWCELQTKSSHRFFLSWHWMHAWLRSVKPSVTILLIKHQNQIVGLCLLCFKRTTRHKFLSIKQCFLHETGDPNSDQQWIEYNDFLIADSHRQYVYPLLVETLKNKFEWDEFLLGVSSEDKVEQFTKTSGLSLLKRWESQSHGIDLTHLRAQYPDYLSSLSKNKRSQIRRSLKHYEKQGSLSITHAKTLEQGLCFFNEINPIHKKRWGTGYQQSGFANPIFIRFHETLIRNNWDKGHIDLIKISCAGRAIAYFYNFVYQQRVYFYLSALADETDNKLKPGIIGHALCIQEYLDAGLVYYDFMGGGEPYKDSLAQRTGKFYRVSYQKPVFKLKLEQTLRNFKTNALSTFKNLHRLQRK